MKIVLRQLLKKLSDDLIGAVGNLTPDWTAARGAVAAPAVEPHPLPMPLNAEQLPVDYRGQFGETLSLPERRIHLLRGVYVSWHGVVFQNLRLFRPSVEPLRRLEAEYSGGFLLRQWWRRARVAAPADEVIGLAHGPWAVGNYYHWMIDTLPRLVLLQRHYPGCRLLVPEPIPGYVRQTAALFGFERLLPLRHGQIAAVPQLAMPDYAACPGLQDPALSQAAREIVLRAVVGPDSPAGSRRVYVSRSRQQLRRLVNEAAIEPLLREYGFETVFFEDLSFEQQVRLMHETAVLVGVHGANLTNMLFMAPQATVVELMNEEVFNSCYYYLATALQLDYYHVPCRSAGRTDPALDSNDDDVEIDPTALQRVFSSLFATD